jgi:hypothetical protein
MTFTLASRIATLAADLDELRPRLIVAPIVELLHSLAELLAGKRVSEIYARSEA